MAKKKATSKETRKGFPSKKLLLISISLALLIILSAVIYHVFWSSQNNVEFPLRAVIVDQVGADIPSSPEEMQRFNETIFNILRKANFEVCYYESKSVTVNLYRRLAKENYGVIILRVHSAIRERETLVDFFTSEEYRQNVYSNELNSGLLTRGNYSWLPNKYYFAITPKFVMEAMEGNFPGSIIIAMGCSSLNEAMADAFIQKGAKVYIGWTDAVSIIHSDNSTIRFLQQLLECKKTIREAIEECKKFKDPDPRFHNAMLSYKVKEDKIANYQFSDFAAKMVLGVLFTFSRGKRLS